MKGCLSYEAVKRIASGATAQEAAEGCVREFYGKLKKPGKRSEYAISLICMDKHGNFGAGTTIEFPYAAALHQLQACVFKKG